MVSESMAGDELRHVAMSATSAASVSYRSVLVVDDHQPTLRLFDRILTQAGYAVRTAGDGDEALAAIAVERPALVLTDLQMPRLPGAHLVAHLQRHHPQIRIIVTSAGSSGESVPGVPFLAKPFALAQLLTLVRETLPNWTESQEGRT
jgi:two-component system response regulator GlrR